MKGVFSLQTLSNVDTNHASDISTKNSVMFAGSKTILNKLQSPDIVVDTKEKSDLHPHLSASHLIDITQSINKTTTTTKNKQTHKMNVGRTHLQHIFLLCSCLVYYLKVNINYTSRSVLCFIDTSHTRARNVEQKIQKLNKIHGQFYF